MINFASGAGIDGQVNQAVVRGGQGSHPRHLPCSGHEWAADNQRQLISPLALTEGVEAYIAANPHRGSAAVPTPLHRFGDPESDIGRVAVFLASADASYITGQTLMVDGGSIKLR